MIQLDVFGGHILGIKNILQKTAAKVATKLDIYSGTRISSFGYNVGESITQDYQAESLLNALRSENNVGRQIELIVDKDPDASMAVWTFTELAYQGGSIEIYDLNNKRLPDAENQWNNEVKNWNPLSGDGLDGIIKMLHRIGLMYNGMCVEVVVGKKQSENTFSGIYIIDPREIEWQVESVGGVTTYVPYQQQQTGMVNLSKGNFLYNGVNPGLNKPTGSFVLESVVTAIDFKLQRMLDSHAVLRKQGYPYNIVTIDREAVFNSMPKQDQNDPQKIKEAVLSAISMARETMTARNPTQDIVVTNDISVEKNSNASASSSIDFGALFKDTDIQILNGLKAMSILLNRPQGTTETWGTVQMKAMTDMIKSFQRGSKRLVEDIGAIWLQLNGIQGYLKYTHNPIDMYDEIQKATLREKDDTHYQLCQNQRWISADEAAKGAAKVDKADADIFALGAIVGVTKPGNKITEGEVTNAQQGGSTNNQAVN